MTKTVLLFGAKKGWNAAITTAIGIIKEHYDSCAHTRPVSGRVIQMLESKIRK